MSADKQTPSAIDYLVHMKEALEIERRLGKAQTRPLKDMLSSLVATYNRMATTKAHRIDANKKALIYNMLPGTYTYQIVFSIFQMGIRFRAPI